MAWFGDGLSGLSNLKGQITSFTKEVLSEGIVEEIDDRLKPLNEANEKCVQLQEILNSKDAEISLLRRQNCELQKAVIELNAKSKDANESTENDEGGGFFWDPPSAKHRHSKKQKHERSIQQEELATAALKIAELETELKRMQKIAASSIKDQIPNDHGNAELLHAKQDMVNRMIQMDEKSRETEKTSKRSQLNETVLVNDFRMAIAQLEAPEKLTLLKSALKALQAENENKETAKPRETSNNESEAQLRKKIEELSEENARLLASVEQLDEEHQQSLEELLSLKNKLEKKHKCLQNAYEELYVDFNDSQNKVAELEKLLEANPTAKVEISSRETAEQSVQTEVADSEVSKDEEVTMKVKNILKNVCIDAKPNETIFEAIAREYVGVRWKKDFLERKVSELTRDLKETVELKESLQIDCDDMQAQIDSLLAKIQRFKVNNLPSIPEGSEEQVVSLETETESLQEEIQRLESENRTLIEKNERLMVLVRNFKDAKNNGEISEIGQDEGIVDDSNCESSSSPHEIKAEAEVSISARISLEKQVERLSKDNEDLLRRNEELETELSRWREENSRREDRILKQDEDESEKSLGQQDWKDDQLAKLIQQKESLVRENAYLTEQLTATHEESLDKIELLNTEKTLLEQENTELKDEINVIQGKFEETNNAYGETKQALDKLSNNVSDMRSQNACLENKIKELEELAEKERLFGLEHLNAQKLLQDKCTKVEAELEEYRVKEKALINVQEDYFKLKNELQSIESLRAELEVVSEKYRKLDAENQCLLREREELTASLDKTKEKQAAFSVLEEEFHTLTNKCDILETERTSLETEKEQLMANLLRKDEERATVDSLEQNLRNTINKCEDLEKRVESLLSEKEELLSVIDGKKEDDKQDVLQLLEEKSQENESLKNENSKLLTEVVELRDKYETSVEKGKESAGMAKQTIEDLSLLIKEKDDLISRMKLNAQGSEQLNTLRRERDELVKLVQIKHNESLQYHGEIQRLTEVLKEQTSQLQRLTVTEKEKETEITWTKNELRVAQQRLKYLEESSNSTDICNNVEHSTLAKNISVLTEKSNALEAALDQEQMNNRHLQNQLLESQQKESNAAKELERLRTHLVEQESNYTEEALQAEEARKQMEAKLAQAEEFLKNSSTVYTSASIRANQQVETLQQQITHIVQQRDDIQKKLCSAEDKILSQTASLTNLQIVLEQFQRDKESDIEAATERVQRQLKESHEKQEKLLKEVQNLKEQLTEARKYVQAASRLSEELDKKAEKVVQLNQEVARLSNLLDVAEGKLAEVENCGAAKVDKNLVKNLLLGYVSSSAADKSSVLRVFATVLDFNDSERDKVGLNGNNAQNSWFARLSGAGVAPTKEQETSLSAAFVKFLETESKPKPQLPALPISSTPLAKPGHSRQPSTSSTQSTLLLSNVTLPTFPDFVPARNTGSILKEVLKDS